MTSQISPQDDDLVVTAVDIRDQVEAKLTELGDTPDAIADRLRALGIKGRQGFMTCCPIANFLRSVDGVEVASVSGGRDVCINFNSDDELEINTPEAVRTFIHHFDKGVYLDLVEVAA